MNTSTPLLGSALLWWAVLVVWPEPCPLWGASEAFEIGPHNKQALPGGKEADGIIGDFVLRNNRIEAVVSGNLPLRRANMSTFSGETGITPGCLYDLTLRGENNDQITIFAPSSQQGHVSYVRVAQDGAQGEAIIETVVSAAGNNGLYKHHEYRLKDDWQGVLVVTTYRNESSETKSGTLEDRWTNFTLSGKTRDMAWADAVDPADRAGYAYGWMVKDGFEQPPQVLKLEPGQSIVCARFLAVARSPLEALGLVMAQREPTGRISGAIKDTNGKRLGTPKVEMEWGGKRVPAYPDAGGGYAFQIAAGTHALRFSDLGRPTVEQTVTVAPDQHEMLDVTMAAASVIEFDIRGEDGASLPCKAQFLGIEPTPSPNLGPQNRAHGCKDQYHSETGQFRVQVPPGRYKVVVTRGIEYAHLAQEVGLEPGQTAQVQGTLKRLIQSPGWISADFHNHSTPSGDNTCATDDRIINLAAEHIEFAPTTEHNRLYDWQPHIERLGLTNEVATVPGLELTGPQAHFNAFPYEPKPYLQDNGAPVWHKDPRISAVIMREFQGIEADRWVQINHPDMVANFIDRDADGRVDGGYLGLGQLLDAAETINGLTATILSGSPFHIGKDTTGKEIVIYNSEFIWLQMLNRGAVYWCVAVSDAHSVHGNGVGGWRMYVPSSSDQPSRIDWREISRHSKNGRIMVTTGPYLEVRTADGVMAGGQARATGGIELHVKVQCTDWIDIDRVQVLVNGRPEPKLNFTRKSHPDWFKEGVVRFERELRVPLSQDSHVIVVAIGENRDLSVGFGSSPQAAWRPCAYINPIFVDVDGGGFKPNGDTLGWPLPVKGLTVADVKRMLNEHGFGVRRQAQGIEE